MKIFFFALIFLHSAFAMQNHGSKYYLSFETLATGDQEVPPLDTDTTSLLEITVDAGFTMMEYRLNVYDGVEIDRAHFHCGEAGVGGNLILEFFNCPEGRDVNGLLNKGVITTDTLLRDGQSGATDCGVNNIASLFAAMKAGKVYLNVHSLPHPSPGVNRGQIMLFPFE